MIAGPASPHAEHAAPRGRRLALALSLLLTAPWVLGFGPYRPAGLGPTSLGMADATVAAGAGTLGLYANPAGLAQIRQYRVEAGGGWDPRPRAGSFFANAADATSPSGLGGGIGYSWQRGRVGTESRGGHDVRMGMAWGARSDQLELYLGGTARWLDFDPGPGDTLRGWTGDVGAAMAIGQIVRIGAVYRNVTTLDPHETPRRLGAGVAVTSHPLLLAFDAEFPLEGVGGLAFRGGAAFVIKDMAQLRAGYRWDNALPDADALGQLTFGLGFLIDRVSIEAAAGIDLAEPSNVQVTATLGAFLPDVLR